MADCGSIKGLLQKCNNLPERLIAFILYNVLDALKSMHKKSIMHRNITTSNVLFNSKGEIKLSDYSTAIRLTKQNDLRSTMVISPKYTAPEQISGQ